MKNNFFRFSVLAAGTMLLLSSCDKKENGLVIKNNSSVEFVASMPSIGIDAVDTKTTTTDGTRVLWCNEDRISIFRGRNVNEEYKVKDGFGGKTTTTFTKVNDDDFSAGSGEPFDANIAYYPYGNIEYIGSNGNHALSVNTPNTQTYVKGSFGEGALPMVAVTSSKNDNALDFKNIFGFLKLQFKSADGELLIKSITIKGNNNEKLNGAATINCSAESAPVIKFSENAGNSITLECNSTAINATTATDFWFALPPVTFANGITVEIVTSVSTVVKKTSASLTITRSRVKPMQVLTIKAEAEDRELDIPDANFKKYLLEHCDMNGDGRLTLSDAEKWNSSESIKEFNISNQNISSLKGIEHFTALTRLRCEGNQLTTIDISKNTALVELWCGDNQLSTIDISKNTALATLYCNNNKLTNLNINNNTALRILYCHNNQLTTLNVDMNTALITLHCENNQLTYLNLSMNNALTYLACSGNQLKTLNINKNTKLTSLSCSSNQLTVLDLSKNNALTYLACSENKLITLDISKNNALTYMNCFGNQITTLDLSKNIALTSLSCSSNQITTLDLSKNIALTYLYCHNNQLTALDINKNIALTFLWCNANQLTVLDLSKNTALIRLKCNMPSLKKIYLKNGHEIDGITGDHRSKDYINENTEIVFVD